MDTLRVRWVENVNPDALPVTQVSGFCFDGNGRILLIEDAGQFGLPGGKPEGTERIDETLKREVFEEAQVILRDVQFLGYQRVEGDPSLMDGAPYAQIRAIARIAEILPSALDPASGRIYRRFLCLASCVPGLLGWGVSADAQVAAACRLAHRTWGLSFAEPAQSPFDGLRTVKECVSV